MLLHPEGTATWQAERVSRLRGGIAEMALAAAKASRDSGQGRPVFIVPVVWRLVFLGDASPGLQRELALIERALALPSGAGRDLLPRFATLLAAMLAARAARLGLPAGLHSPVPAHEYFAAQAEALAAVRARLAERHGPVDDDLAVAQRALRTSIRECAERDPEGARRDRDLLVEFQRLRRLDPALYGRGTLTQEQIAEVLKATRSALVTKGWRSALHNTVPVAAAPRVAHVRVPDPIAAAPLLQAGASQAAIVEQLHERLQGTLEALGTELEPALRRFRRPNPLHHG